VVVGSYALAVHAQPRATGDLDVLVDTAPENAQAVFNALAEFGAPLQGFTPKDFEDPTTIFQVGVSPIRIDIIKRISGLTSKQYGLVPFHGSSMTKYPHDTFLKSISFRTSWL
jgi:hypothetical protein